MKKLEIIIKPEKLEDLKALLDSEEVNGLNIVNSMGYGNQKGIIKNYRGAEENPLLANGLAFSFGKQGGLG